MHGYHIITIDGNNTNSGNKKSMRDSDSSTGKCVGHNKQCTRII